MRMWVWMLGVCFSLSCVCALGAIEPWAFDERFSFRSATSAITISISDMDIQNVVGAFARQTRVNVIMSDDIKGKVTLVLENAPPAEALTSILASKGYSWYAQDGKTVVITASKLFHTFPIRYASSDEVYKTLEKIVGAEGSVSVNLSSNTVMVHGTTSSIFKIAHALKRLDVIPRQVVVQTRILELSVENDSNLGVVAKYLYPPSGDVETQVETKGFAKDVITEGLLTILTFGSDKFKAILNALEKDTNFNVRNAPMIVAANNKEAQVLVGQRIGYRETTNSPSNVTTETIKFLEVGTKLRITPRINDDNSITLYIHPEVSSGSIDAQGLPQVTTTEATTEVTVMNGDTVVIAGLIKDSDKEVTTGIPFLKNVPIVGIAFRNKLLDLEKKEIILFMTPNILNERVRQTFVEDGEISNQEHPPITRRNVLSWK